MINLNIAVDSGKHSTEFAFQKGKNFIVGTSFPTYIYEDNSDDSFKSGKIVKFEEKSFRVGQQYQQYHDEKDTKLSETHFICVYTAICDAIEQCNYPTDHQINVNLAINVPLSEYRNVSIRSEYKDNYENKNINIEVENKYYSFKIVNVMPYCESQGTLFRESQLYSHLDDIYIIDIGGRNDTHMRYKNGVPVGDYCTIGENGIIAPLNKIASELSTIYHQPFTSDDVERIAKNPEKYDMKKLSRFFDIFNSHMIPLVDKIYAKFVSTKINVLVTKLVFSGGGADILDPILKKKIITDYIISADPYNDNCLGALRKLVSIYEK